MKHMKHILSSLAVACVALSISGCAVGAQKYSMSIENASKLKQLSKRTDNKINVGNFTSSTGKGFEGCRIVDTIETPSGKPYEKYLQDAINAEFIIADLQDTSGETLTANITKLDLDNPVLFADGVWTISVDFTLGNHTFTIDNKQIFETLMDNKIACVRAAWNFDELIQGTVSQLASNPIFIKAINESQKTTHLSSNNL